MSWIEDYRKRLQKKRNNISENLSENNYPITLLNSDTIDIYCYKKRTDSHGIVVNGWFCEESNFIADVNDMTDEKKEKEWGYDLEVDKTIYCVPNSHIIESSLIKYDNKFYSISKIKRCKIKSLQDNNAYYKIAIKLYTKDVKIIEGDD